MKLSDFDFDLPEDLIATRPAVPRSSARLLVAEQDRIHDARVTDLVSWLNPGDRLVLNDTKVIPARLSGSRHRDSAQGPVEARIEVTLLANGYGQMGFVKGMGEVEDLLPLFGYREAGHANIGGPLGDRFQ